MELPSRQPWQHFSGAQLPCDDRLQRRCFLWLGLDLFVTALRLAAWDGERLPVVWLRGKELTPSALDPIGGCGVELALTCCSRL